MHRKGLRVACYIPLKPGTFRTHVESFVVIQVQIIHSARCRKIYRTLKAIPKPADLIRPGKLLPCLLVYQRGTRRDPVIMVFGQFDAFAGDTDGVIYVVVEFPVVSPRLT